MTHRDDIQGLRGVAVLLVVLCHAGVPFLSGGYVGVDVFFVLSGFLITGVLLAEFSGRGAISLTGFYARRARRIVPAAALTLVVTDVAAHHLLNFVRAREAVHDSIWSSFFAANVHFARQQSNYFAQGQPPSPFLHFWSLAVEEQFYLVWPTLLAALLLLRVRRLLLLVVGAAGAASLAWSIHETAASRTAAYFSTITRAWELALGAALAIAVPTAQRISPRAGTALGCAGLVAIASSAAWFSSRTPFPGVAALLPATGAAAVIGAGIGGERGATRLLSLRPLRYVGDRSYALYLWHWPVLVIGTAYIGRLRAIDDLGLLALAFLLSIASYRLVENPIRSRRLPVPVGSLLWPASAAAVIAVGLPILASIDEKATRIDVAAAAVKPEALSTGAHVALSVRPLPAVVAAVRQAQRGAPLPSPITPPADRLRGDFYAFPPGCTAGDGETSSKVCRLGARNAAKTLVVIGDSHAQMWMPTILQLARSDGWSVIPFVKTRCIPRSWPSRGECGRWYRWAKARAAKLRPTLTLVIGSWMQAWAPSRAVAPIASLTTAMKRSSASVVVVGDPPGQSRDPTECLLAPHATMATCSTRVTETQLRTYRKIAADAKRHGVGFVDTTGWFCAQPRGSRKLLCPLVVNRTATCVDRGHISKTYALELAPPFRSALRRELFG